MRHVPVGRCFNPRCLRFSTDGKTLILADWFGTFRILDAVAGTERLKLEPQKLEERRYNDIRALAVSRDGKTAVTIYYGDSLVVWDLVGGKRLREFTFRNSLDRHTQKPIVLTPDGKRLVVPYKDGSLHLLDVTSGKEVFAFEMSPKQLQNGHPIVTISPDGRYLAYGGASYGSHEAPFNSVTLCDMTTGKRLRELSSKERINEWVFLPNSRSLAVSDAKTICFFDVPSGKKTKSLHKSWGGGLVFSSDGRKLAASVGTCILLRDVESGKILHSPIGHDWFIRSLQFSRDGKRLVSNTSGDIIVWDVAQSRTLAANRTGQLPRWISVTADGEAIRFVDWKQRPSPRRTKKSRLNERGLIEGEAPRPSGMEREKIHGWHLATDRTEQPTEFSIPAAYDWFVLSPDGRRVAVVTNESEPNVSLGDVKDGKRMVPAALPDKSRVVEVMFSMDGRRLLLRSWYGALRVLDGVTGQKVRDWKPDTSGQRLSSTPVLAPDGRSVALNDGQTLFIWEAASGKNRLQTPLMGPTNDLAFSPNGRFLACNSHNGSDPSTYVYSTVTGKLLARWQGEQGTATALAFSPDSRLLATGGYDGTILIWKIPEEDGLPAKLSKEETAALWQALADDAARANRALFGLAAAPAQAIALIQERFPTAWQKSDAKQLANLITELDDDAFQVRERATRELAEAGSDAAAALRKALANKPSPEAKRRIEGLLDRLNKGGSPKRLRSLRAIEVLERIGTAPAREALRELSRKPLPAELREEIDASLRRIEANTQLVPRRSKTP
jgi:WD40 repeat protein